MQNETQVDYDVFSQKPTWSKAAVYATGLKLRSGDTHVKANRYSNLLFFIIQFPYLQQILC